MNKNGIAGKAKKSKQKKKKDYHLDDYSQKKGKPSKQDLLLKAEEFLQRNNPDEFDLNSSLGKIKLNIEAAVENPLHTLSEKGKKVFFNKNKKKKSHNEDLIALQSYIIENQKQINIALCIANEDSANEDESMISSKPNPLLKDNSSNETELKLKQIVLKEKYTQLRSLMDLKGKGLSDESCSSSDYLSSVNNVLKMQQAFLTKINKQKKNSNPFDSTSENDKQLKEFLANAVQLELELDKMINMHKPLSIKEDNEARIEIQEDYEKSVQNEEEKVLVNINQEEDYEYSLFSPENHLNYNDYNLIKPQTPFCFTQGGDNIKDVKDLAQVTKQEISKSPRESKECFICLKDFLTNNSATFLPCQHFFHSACIKERFKKDPSCPICKDKIARDIANKA